MHILRNFFLLTLSACCSYNSEYAMQSSVQAQQNAKAISALQLKLRDAIFNNDAAAIKAALAAGANINTRYRDFRGAETTILAQSIPRPLTAGSFESLQRVLAFPGLNINTPETPQSLRLLAYDGGLYGNQYMDALKALLEAGANVNGKEADGNTVLHTITRSIFEFIKIGQPTVNMLIVLNLLLRYGADPEISDGTGKTALDLARAHPELPGVLKALQNGRTAYLQVEAKAVGAGAGSGSGSGSGAGSASSAGSAGSSQSMNQEDDDDNAGAGAGSGSGAGAGSGSHKRKDRASEDEPEDTQGAGKRARKS